MSGSDNNGFERSQAERVTLHQQRGPTLLLRIDA